VTGGTTETSISAAVERLKSLFIEMPGTKLSAFEAARLAGLDTSQCEPVLNALVTAGFLTRGHDGRYFQACSFKLFADNPRLLSCIGSTPPPSV
jgi:hypothetical protein